MTRRPILLAAPLALMLSGCGEPASDEADATAASTTLASENLNADSFGCISELTAVGRFFVGNLNGDLDATLAVAQSDTGGTYPAGSVVQLVPTEAMVKRAPGFSAETKDWEFFDLDISPEGTKILTRGHADVVNRFGGNCLECHEKAEPQWDLICSTDHGCDPIPLNDAMIRALQKTDPRCPAQELSEEEQEGLKALQALLG
ncbi:hypothetical protein [Altererythrobacter sp.]|uniref:hypothetical protein n=1 Tax=Altererythrobacter sp. TaxID=1872480 RepID=UPI003D07C614